MSAVRSIQRKSEVTIADPSERPPIIGSLASGSMPSSGTANGTAARATSRPSVAATMAMIARVPNTAIQHVESAILTALCINCRLLVANWRYALAAAIETNC